MVEARDSEIRPQFQGADQQFLREIEAYFLAPNFSRAQAPSLADFKDESPTFRSWADTNLTPHKAEGYTIVSINLKKHGNTPGDATAAQMRVMAELAQEFSHDELRISHEQNVILPHVHRADLPTVYSALRAAGLATANIGLISDIIACPGMDYCALATARSIPIAQQVATHFAELKLEHDIGPFKLKISGCIRIELPSFADGRGFTLATLLRRRGYVGHLQAFGHVLADQYAMARRSGFDDVKISDELATRQSEAQWQYRADWRAHDYQTRLRQPAT